MKIFGNGYIEWIVKRFAENEINRDISLSNHLRKFNKDILYASISEWEMVERELFKGSEKKVHHQKHIPNHIKVTIYYENYKQIYYYDNGKVTKV